jgi:putative N6-adenine-specific DNA methylase
LRWVATCARGLEEILEAEMRSLGLAVDGRDVGGVRFAGAEIDGVRANWRLRTANRILFELGSWPAADDDALYRGARALRDELLHPDRSFAITATSTRSAVRDTRWVALKVKDGLVDGQRDRFGRRATVERADPELALRVRLHEDHATLLVDTSGAPLDRRGYRVESTVAPLREQLTAAALLASGWNGRGPVVDPMCGSGTFLAEAGAIALGLAPNRLREHWGFERLPGFGRALLERVRSEKLAAPDPDVELIGVDRDRSAIVAARRNLDAAGLAAHAILEIGDAFELEPPAAPGLVTVNPPHGVRLEAEAEAWRRIGDLLKSRYRGWKAIVVAADARLGKELGLRARRIPFWNGPVEGRFLILDLW